MDEALFLLTAAGLGVLWWRHRRPRPERVPAVDDALDHALRVAADQARARGHAVEPLHLLQGLLRDVGVRHRATKLRADVAAIERRIISDLDRTLRSATAQRPYTQRAERVLRRMLVSTQSGGRSAGLSDLLASLLHVDPAAARACAAGGIRAVDLLFVLVHDVPERELPVPDAPELAAVLVNDDLSTMELVVEVLEQDFGLGHERAHELMLRTHHEGRAEVGRFPAAEAQARAAAASARARERGFPLLVRLEA